MVQKEAISITQKAQEVEHHNGHRQRNVCAFANLGAGFVAAPENERVAALRKVEATPFFQNLRVQTLQVLYSTPLAYAYFGYEGEAFSKGGYLQRGFNDLRWLPEVPPADSGPVLGV